MARKRVLITGAAGYLSRQLLPVFLERYDLVLLDRRKPHDIDDIIEVDLVNPDIDTYRGHFKGVDAIVHNTRSTRPGVNTGAPRQWLKDRPLGDLEGYYVERDSLDMAYHVFRLAQEEGVTRVVTASSNHATDWYETNIPSSETFLMRESRRDAKSTAILPFSFPKAEMRCGSTSLRLNSRSTPRCTSSALIPTSGFPMSNAVMALS